MSSVPGVSAFPEGDNLLSWVGTIQGAAGTVSNSDCYFHCHNINSPKRYMKGFLINYLSNSLLVIHTYLPWLSLKPRAIILMLTNTETFV